MGIKGTVRRNQDGHFIHANIDLDIIITEEPYLGDMHTKARGDLPYHGTLLFGSATTTSLLETTPLSDQAGSPWVRNSQAQISRRTSISPSLTGPTVTSWGILRKWSPFGQRPRPSRRGVVGVVEGLEGEGGGEEEEEEVYEGESTMGGDFSDVDLLFLFVLSSFRCGNVLHWPNDVRTYTCC